MMVRGTTGKRARYGEGTSDTEGHGGMGSMSVAGSAAIANLTRNT